MNLTFAILTLMSIAIFNFAFSISLTLTLGLTFLVLILASDSNSEKTLAHENVPYFRIRYWVAWYNMRKYMSKMPASSFSYLFQMMCGISQIFRKEGLFKLSMFRSPFVIIYKPDLVAEILNNSSITDRPKVADFMKIWCGDSLFLRKGSEWKCRRKLLNTALRSNVYDHFLHICNEKSQVLIREMKKSVTENSIDISPLILSCSFDIMCEGILGVGIQENSKSEYFEAILWTSEVVWYRFQRPWLWPDFVFNLSPIGRFTKKKLNFVHEFSLKVISKKKSEIINNMNNQDQPPESTLKKSHKSFLEILIKHHLEDPSFTEEDIKNEVTLFTTAGHDTTANTITWALHDFGLYPEVQENVYAEINEVLSGDKLRFLTMEDLKAMKYLDRAIKESARLHPVVPIVSRAIYSDINLANYTIKGGSTCVILIYMLHRDPDIYPNPEKFDPDRFLPANVAARHSCSHIPFSAGPRNCIAQKYGLLETKAVIANIIRHYKVKSLDRTENLIVPKGITLHSINPIRIHLSLRED